MKEEKRVGLRRCYEDSRNPGPEIMFEADRWLKTVQEIRRTGKVARRGLYKFVTFEEADQWMEAMILESSRESPP